MSPLFDSLRPFIRYVVRRPALVIGVAILLTALGLSHATRLQVDTDLANLIPQDYPSVQALEKLRQTVGGESDVAVVIESPSFEANKTFAEALIPRALALKGKNRSEPYLTRVEYRKDTAFMERNALYFATNAELDSLEAYLEEKRQEATQEVNPFFFDLEEELEDEEGAGTETVEDDRAQQFQALYEQIVGKEYPISDDSTTMVVRFYPSGSQTNIGYIEALYEDLDQMIAGMDASSYHPEMKITLAGRLLRQATEVRAVTNDVISSFGAGVLSVLLAVVLYFFYKAYTTRAGFRYSRRILLSELARTPVMALLIGLPLLMSLSWTFGLAYLAFGSLNLMTSTLGLVLFGLGIDYGIHFYARYTEERSHGHSVEKAAEITFTSTGQAIAVGAATTAVALYVLMMADFKGFSEFGFIAGTGILLALVSMTVVLPALISLGERFRLLNLEAITPKDGAQHVRSRRFPASRAFVVGSVAAVVAALVLMPRVRFEYDFGKLEPEYKEYNEKAELVRRVYKGGGGRNPAYVIVDSPEEVQAVVAAIEAHRAQDTLSPTISHVETLQERFPLQETAQQAKLQRIAAIREMLDSPFLSAESSEDIERLKRAAQTRDPITLDEVPASIKSQFTTKSGEIGLFVMIYPSVGLSDGRQSMAFSEDVGTITTADGRVYHAGSTSLVAADMLRLMQQEAPWMVGATFLIVTLLMWANFRSWRWAVLALLPLVVGLLWMMLLMELFHITLTFYNLVVLPAVLGYGNDAGVHLTQRYREEGRGSIMHVLRSTGEHVTMSSITTMMGFGGQLFSFHPGLHSIGELAVVGIGATWLGAMIFLPALVQWWEDRRGGGTSRRPSPEVPEVVLAQ